MNTENRSSLARSRNARWDLLLDGLSCWLLSIGVILAFTLLIFPQDNAVLSLFPFSSPYQTLAAAEENNRVFLFLGVCAAEILLFGALELIYQKLRRCVE